MPSEGGDGRTQAGDSGRECAGLRVGLERAGRGDAAEILGGCWSEDAVYVDPNVELKGRAALSERISTVQASRPGAWIEMMSGVDVHHNVVRFLWRLVRADGSAGDISIDFGEVDA